MIVAFGHVRRAGSSSSASAPARKKPLRADDLVALAERESEADGPEADGRDREVDQDLRDHRARVLAAGEADLQEGEARLHEHHEDAGDQHPHGVDPDLDVGQLARRWPGRASCRPRAPPRVQPVWRAARPPHRSPNGSCASILLCQTASRLSLGGGPVTIIVPVSKIPSPQFSLRSRRARCDEHRDVVADGRRRPVQARARGSAATVSAARVPRARGAAVRPRPSVVSVRCRRARLGQPVGVEQQRVAGLQLDLGVGDVRVVEHAQQRARARRAA